MGAIGRKHASLEGVTSLYGEAEVDAVRGEWARLQAELVELRQTGAIVRVSQDADELHAHGLRLREHSRRVCALLLLVAELNTRVGPVRL